MLTLRVQNTSTFIDGWVEQRLKDSLRLAVGFEDEAARFRAKAMPGYDGVISTLCFGYGKRPCKCAVKKKGMHFPTGLLGRVMNLFDTVEQPYRIIDDRPQVSCSTEFSVDPDQCEERGYQMDIVEKATSPRGGRGIVKMATGGGKTGTAARLMAKLGAMPFIFFVPSKDLLAQAKSEFERFILKNGQKIEVGAVGAGKREIRDITVMTVQTAVRALDPDRFKDKRGRKKKVKLFEEDDEYDCLDAPGEVEEETDLGEFYKEVRSLVGDCKGFICDEVQHWASETCQLVADHAKNARFRFGFSATPWRDKGDDMLIDACFGKPICDINASFLIDNGYLVPPTIYYVPIDNYKHAIFDDYADAYTRGIVQNELRNQYISNIAQNLVKSGRTVLVLVKHIEHGDTLEAMNDNSFFIHGSHTGKQREDHINLMRKRLAPITIASTIFDEGIDVRPLDAVILAGSGKSQTRALQRIGRAIRPYSCDGFVKKDAVIIDFFDDMKWMRQHSKARQRIYQTEPRFLIKWLTL